MFVNNYFIFNTYNDPFWFLFNVWNSNNSLWSFLQGNWISWYQQKHPLFACSYGCCTVPLISSIYYGTRKDHQRVLISRGWTQSSAIWEPTTSYWRKQSTWLRTALCGGWCLHMALHTPSNACQRRRIFTMVIASCLFSCRIIMSAVFCANDMLVIAQWWTCVAWTCVAY